MFECLTQQCDRILKPEKRLRPNQAIAADGAVRPQDRRDFGSWIRLDSLSDRAVRRR
jgi:hypothetical protein